ncbi:hypothetical protein [Acinetobacter sp. YH12238]|uniref:hypothetical protein n=1 Tax=Acinetobacter sp. YH12238 TaxID=2601165 RepID=UPI0015D20C74|nr:hypothetical protein [Acinetobacter sp. YH12238]
MTEIQQTNIVVANFIISELHKEKPFNLVLDAGETGALYEIAVDMRHLNSDFVDWVVKVTKSRKVDGTGIIIRVQKHFVHQLYNMLALYINKHDQYSVVKALGEVS